MEIDYRKITRQAIAYATKKGYPQDAEDFAQECCLYARRRGLEDVFISRRFTDYLRANYGRSNTPSGNHKRIARMRTSPYNESTMGSEQKSLALIGVLDCLSRYERLIFVLHHKYDVPLDQIADSQGVGKARISQVLRQIQAKLDGQGP